MYCEWTCLQKGCICPRCGYILKRDYTGPPKRECEKENAEPSLSKKAWNYAAAVARWKLAGSPTRTKEEIAELFAICKSCPHFVDDSRPHCGLCGCSCGEGAEPLKNKLAMRTEESCPDDPPRWVRPFDKISVE
jgi:hypothetical protein